MSLGVVTNAGGEYLLNLLSNNEVPVDNYYIALVNGSKPSVTATGDDLEEPLAADYVRVPYQNVSGFWSITGGVLSNALEIDWPPIAFDWGNIGHWAICDQLSSGRALFVGSMTDVVQIAIGDNFYIPIGGISITFSNLDWQVYT